MRARSLWLCGSSFVAVLGIEFSASAVPMFQGLGDLSGGSFSSRAIGISADGSVVVGTGTSASGDEAFRWEDTGTCALDNTGDDPRMAGLGDLPGSIFRSTAGGVSADGSVVVGDSYSASGPEAFRWDSEGGMVGLGLIPGHSAFSSASATSADGSVVVGYSQATAIPDFANRQEAFLWTSDGDMVGLGDLPGGSEYPSGSFQSVASGVSADGSVVVGGGKSDSGHEAFRWEDTGTCALDNIGDDPCMVGLGNHPGGFLISSAHAVSADGSVVVGQSSVISDWEAFRWTSEGGMVGLGDLPGGEVRSTALGVSAEGSVVVGYSNSASGFEAFVWDSTTGMRSIDQVLNNLGVDLTGWSLTRASAVSADGLTIVGNGTNPSGFTEGWIAYIGEPVTPPRVPSMSPASLLIMTGLRLMTAGLLGLAGYRRGRARG
jgi:probable HAF family extracellular repeat protein